MTWKDLFLVCAILVVAIIGVNVAEPPTTYPNTTHVVTTTNPTPTTTAPTTTTTPTPTTNETLTLTEEDIKDHPGKVDTVADTLIIRDFGSIHITVYVPDNHTTEWGTITDKYDRQMHAAIWSYTYYTIDGNESKDLDLYAREQNGSALIQETHLTAKDTSLTFVVMGLRNKTVSDYMDYITEKTTYYNESERGDRWSQ